jgi:oligopeptide transport system substrate-binding protein
MVSLLYEGLTRCLPDGSSELALAEKIDISPDGKTYVFHLRKSFWSDGVPVTAHDFEQSWKQELNPKMPSICAYLLYPIKNAEAAFHQTKSLDEVGVRALDDLTLEVILERKTPYFISLTSFPSFFPAPQHRLADLDNPINRPITLNGPFIVKYIEAHASILLAKNPFYWNASKQRLDEIQIEIINSEMTSFAMFERGELDWLGGLLSPISSDALASPKTQEKAKYFPMSASTFFAFNTTLKPFSNENLRKAFCLSIDRQKIANEILPNHQILATRCIPPALCQGKNRDILPSYNPQKAKEYFEIGLKELGETKEDISPIVLHYRVGAVDRMIAQVIQREWTDVLGIEVKLIQTDFKTHKDLLHSRNFQVAIANWVAQYHDPMNILERFKNPSNAKNYSGWDNQEFAELIDQAIETSDEVLRERLIEQAEELIADALPIFPIYHWSNPSLCSSRLKNIHTTPSGGVLFERCWISEKNEESAQD